jgi:hypothetical protein
MKKIIVLFAFLIAAQTLSAYTLSNYDLGINNIMSVSKSGNKIAVLGLQKDYATFYTYSALRIYENGKWDSIQTNFILHDTTKEVITTTQSEIHFDSLGTIWIGSDMMYAYKDGKWSAFCIDDSLTKCRHYNRFCVDAYNNLWIMTSIFDQSKSGNGYLGYSELLKFDGKTFKTVLFTKDHNSFSTPGSFGAASHSIAALKDGRVVIYRQWINSDLDYDKEKLHNMIFYNQDGSYSGTQIPTLSGDKYKDVQREVSSIFADDDNTIWVSLAEVSWMYKVGDKYYIPECCSGLLAYKNNDWIVFDEKNGLPVERSDSAALAARIYRTFQLDKWNYFVLGQTEFFTMGKDYVLKKLNLKDIGEKAVLIKANKFHTVDSYNAMYKFDSTFHNTDINEGCIVNNDEIWLVNQEGIIVIPKSPAILGIAEENTETHSSIYPVPSHDYIQVKSQGIYDEYTIFNQLGEIMQSGRLEGFNTQIDISTLSYGMYYIRLSNKLNQQVYKFVKE